MGLSLKIPFGIEIASNILQRAKIDVADKAKLRAIVGRKATGPTGIAGLPKQKTFCRPVGYILDTGSFFSLSHSKRRDDNVNLKKMPFLSGF